MNIESCLSIVDDLISKIDQIISKNAVMRDKSLLDLYRDVNVQMEQLIRTLFPDADKRLEDYDESTDIASRRDGPSSAERTSFIEQAKATRRYLVSITDALKLRESVEVKESKLEGLRKKVSEKEVESERREKVTETKFYGAAIEIIDRLRDQLKNEGDIKQEIINLKSEIFEMKEILKSSQRDSSNKESLE